MQTHLQECQCRLQHQTDGTIADLTAVLTERSHQLQESQAASDRYQQQLQDSILQVQHSQSLASEAASREAAAAAAAAAAAFQDQLEACHMALQQAEGRLAAEIGRHEASQAATPAQLKDHQSVILLLLAAWAKMMLALHIDWEQPVGADIPQFEHSLLQAQQEAMLVLDDLQHRAIQHTQVNNNGTGRVFPPEAVGPKRPGTLFPRKQFTKHFSMVHLLLCSHKLLNAVFQHPSRQACIMYCCNAEMHSSTIYNTPKMPCLI